MSETLQQARLAERKAERKAQELEERENYQAKLLAARAAEVSELEQTVAKLEKDLHIKEEKWRLADNERQRAYANFRFGGDPDGGADRGGPGDRGARFTDARGGPGGSGRPAPGGMPPPAGPSPFTTTAEKSAQQVHQSEQITALTNKIRDLESQVQRKEEWISNMRGWQAADAHVLGGEDQTQAMMEDQRVRV